jgi:hypothetical protein
LTDIGETYQLASLQLQTDYISRGKYVIRELPFANNWRFPEKIRPRHNHKNEIQIKRTQAYFGVRRLRGILGG